MPRGKKAAVVKEEASEGSVSEESGTKPGMVVNLDVHKLVKNVQGRYKKDRGLAEDLTVGAEIRLSDEPDDYVLSTSISDWWNPLTGIRGVPYGRIVQIAGKADSGKSTTAMMFMKAAQEAGALVILWDSEKKFSIRRYQQSIGGDPTSIVVTRSKNIVEGARQVAWYIREAKEQNPDIRIFIVWDSVGATMNTAEDDDDDDDYSKQPGQTAKQVGWAIKKFNKLIERYRDTKTGKETIALLCVNQVYQMIGSHGSKEKGGETLYYLSSLILQLTRKKDLNRTVSKQKMKYGILSRAKVRKNHLFDGEECIAEMDIVVSADGIQLAQNLKGKTEITGWDDDDED